MGEPFAVWKNPMTNSWSVMSDVCPHRLAPLSQGRINEETGCVECGYHGWQFQNDGTVSVIPQMDKGKSSVEKVKPATSFAVHETGDLLWAFLPTNLHGESFPKTLLHEDYYFPGLKMDMARDATYYVQEMPSSFHMIVENGLDPAHFSFAHCGVIARRDDAAPMPDMKVVSSNFTNLDIYTTYKRNGESRERIYSYQRPCLLYNKEKVPSSNQEDKSTWLPAVLFFLVPIREGRTRIITSVEKVSKSYLPAWVTHLATRRLFEGDYFVHQAELNRVEKNLKYVEPTTSDTGPRAWNKWMQQYGFSDSPAHTFGTASKENLVPMNFAEMQNPWRIHTSTCSKCRAVLRRARKTQRWSILGGILGASLLQGRKKLSVAYLVLSAGILLHFLAKKVTTLMEGSSHPSDAPERSFSMSAK
ncbi:unnamed protein product [Cylindrotheca closterium]|uniref:Rieske domain-containing protein n=1 Tax=Cylindrotheca closterium TaxID=2856 RepID=A0AAD2G3K7_9STRA|nr:unnamed protein product [Cylindrotheca closterium]